jgi:hypothetical protein
MRVWVCGCKCAHFSVISEQSRSLQPLSSVYFEEDTGEMKILKVHVYSVSRLTVHINTNILQHIIDCSHHFTILAGRG